MKDKKFRSWAKSISFRILATTITMILVYVFTGNIKAMAGVGILDVVSKLALYYIHERVWEKISWGLEMPEPTEE